MAPTATTQLGKADAPLATSLASRGRGPREATGAVLGPGAHRLGGAGRRAECTGWKGGGGAGRALSPQESQGGGGRLSGQQSVNDWFRGLSTAPLHIGVLQQPRATHHDGTGQRVTKPTDSSVWEARRSHI